MVVKRSAVLARLIGGALAVVVFGTAAAQSADLVSMMRLTSEHWAATQRPDGTIPYGFDFLADRSTAPNADDWAYVVRQALGTFAWAQYLGLTGDQRAAEPVRRSLAALVSRSLPISKGGAQRWVEATGMLSLPLGRWKLNRTLLRFGLLYEASGPGRVVSPSGKYSDAIIGATGVALLAELAYAAATGDEQFATMRSAWLDGLLTLRVPGRGFRNTPESIDEDDYSNGEAWFGLAAYCDKYRADSRCAQLAELDQVFLTRYSSAQRLEFFPWGSLTAAQRYRTTHDLRFRSFIGKQAEYFAKRLELPSLANANRCAVMEGVAAALGVLERTADEYGSIAARLRTWLASETAKLARLQIKHGQTRLQLGGEAVLASSRLAQFAGAFLLDLHVPSVQIDSAAHCVGALVIIERDKLLARPRAPE